VFEITGTVAEHIRDGHGTNTLSSLYLNLILVDGFKLTNVTTRVGNIFKMENTRQKQVLPLNKQINSGSLRLI
jgi:hypothetical protein